MDKLKKKIIYQNKLMYVTIRSNEEEKYLYIHCHHTHKQQIANKFSDYFHANLVEISDQI